MITPFCTLFTLFFPLLTFNTLLKVHYNYTLFSTHYYTLYLGEASCEVSKFVQREELCRISTENVKIFSKKAGWAALFEKHKRDTRNKRKKISNFFSKLIFHCLTSLSLFRSMNRNITKLIIA